MTHLKSGVIADTLGYGNDVDVSAVGEAIIGVHEIKPSPPRSVVAEEPDLARTMCYVMQVTEVDMRRPCGFPNAFTISRADTFRSVKLQIWRIYRRQFGKKGDFASHQRSTSATLSRARFTSRYLLQRS